MGGSYPLSAETSDKTSRRIKIGLLARMEKACKLLTAADTAMGYNFPSSAEVAEMAQRTADCLEVFPKPGSQHYKIAVAELFGGSVTAVLRKSANTVPAKHPKQLCYYHGRRKDVIIGYPPALNEILNFAHDIVPDIQSAEPEEITCCFPSDEWMFDNNADLRYLVLKTPAGKIRLRRHINGQTRLVVLLRVHGPQYSSPYRIQMIVDQREIAGVDVYQADSFLLLGEIHTDNDTILSLNVSQLNGALLSEAPSVTVPAIRVVCFGGV